MKIMVYPHDMAIGGSQLNAIEIGAAVRDLGHDVVVFGQGGPLETRVSELGLEFLRSPRVGRRPSMSVARFLRNAILSRGVDLVHGYEWPPSLEAVLACRRTEAVAVSTVLSMSVAPFIPEYTPLMVGTEQILHAERTNGRELVGLMEPPVDTSLNAPDIVLGLSDFRRKWNLQQGVFTVVVVSRLAHEMKLEGIVTAISVVKAMNATRPVQLLIVGSGPAEDVVRRHAAAVNDALSTDRIILTGELADPRCAYALADVTLGMGGSALRAMAFGKPLIVQGESGYWSTLTPDTLPTFLWQGWYGRGNGTDDSVRLLNLQLEVLARDEELRAKLGAFSLKTVRERFSLLHAAERQLEFYEDARTAMGVGRRRTAESMRASSRLFAYKISRRVDRLRRNESCDDFNARPLLSSLPSRSSEVAGK